LYNHEDLNFGTWRWLGNEIVRFGNVELLETLFSKEELGRNTPLASRLLEAAIRRDNKNILAYFRQHPPSEPLEIENCIFSNKSTIKEIAYWFNLSDAEVVEIFRLSHRRFYSFEVRVEILKSLGNPLTSEDIHYLIHSDNCNLQKLSNLFKTLKYTKNGPIRLADEFTLEKAIWIHKNKLKLSEFQLLPTLDAVKWYVRNYDTSGGIFYTASGEIENWLLKNHPNLVTLNGVFDDVENVDKKLYLDIINGPWKENLGPTVHKAISRGKFRYLLWLESFVPVKTLKSAAAGLHYNRSKLRLGVAYFLAKITNQPLVAFSRFWEPGAFELAEVEVLPNRDRKTISTLVVFNIARQFLSQPDLLKLQELLPEFKKIKLTTHQSTLEYDCRISGIKGE
jgi:hypothetical protein